ncbi:MAG: response regulator transcription factor [Anaerolineales bacterium]|nr:response regulator transcription factor [Anaerolineales bacterium]
MARPIRILLADDHAILRDGIRALLSDETDLNVVGEAENGRQALEQARALRPDIVIMDIGMPLLSGLEATTQIRRDVPEARVLILTMHQNEEYLAHVLAAGASGYVLKDVAGRELVSAIRQVAGGEAFFSPSMTKTLTSLYLHSLEAERTHDPYDDLTIREREVLQLVAEGFTNHQIAEMLKLSIKTVKTHRLHLMQKLDLHDRTELVKYAFQKGIITA